MKCSLACKVCNRANVKEHKSLDESAADLGVFERQRTVGSVFIAGGHPLTRSSIVEIVHAMIFICHRTAVLTSLPPRRSPRSRNVTRTPHYRKQHCQVLLRFSPKPFRRATALPGSSEATLLTANPVAAGGRAISRGLLCEYRIGS